jgi:hypothetical protein
VGSISCIEVIAKSGKVDFCKTDTNGETAMHYAARSGDMRVVQALISGIPRRSIARVVEVKSSDDLDVEALAHTATAPGENRDDFARDFSLALANAASRALDTAPAPKSKRPAAQRLGAFFERIRRVGLRLKASDPGSTSTQPGSGGGGQFPRVKTEKSGWPKASDSSSVSSGVDSGLGDAEPKRKCRRKASSLGGKKSTKAITKHEYLRQHRSKQANKALTMEMEVEVLKKQNEELRLTLSEVRREATSLRGEVVTAVPDPSLRAAALTGAQPTCTSSA